MGAVIYRPTVLVSKKWSDVGIVTVALGGVSLLWMQGMIGHAASIFSWLGVDLISRSQFSEPVANPCTSAGY